VIERGNWLGFGDVITTDLSRDTMQNRPLVTCSPGAQPFGTEESYVVLTTTFIS
jgi:hypothetical protein